MELIAHCEACGKPPFKGDDHHFDKEWIVWVCRAFVEDEQDRLREAFGWIGAGRGSAGRSVPLPHAPSCEHRP